MKIDDEALTNVLKRHFYESSGSGNRQSEAINILVGSQKDDALARRSKIRTIKLSVLCLIAARRGLQN